jgi:serine/threonine-protein kinase
MSVRCPSCGTTFTGEVTFCGSCGTRLPPEGRLSEEAAEHDPLLGRIVDDRYRVLAKLGEGGMGAVYQVEHVHMGKYMAMKLLLREFSGNRDLVRRFRREAQAVSRLTHANTVQVFDFGRTADGAMYMVMEFIRGENLAAVLDREGPLPARRVARIVSQVCASLSEAHGLGIIHRDLKPENVMLLRTKDERDIVKVLDFGLAKLRERDEGATSHGSLVGTPYYMSPEQIKGGDIDARSDIYSLGAMMYKTVTGDPPFHAPSPIAVLTKHLQDPPRPPREARPDLAIPAALESVILRAMAKSREARYQTVDELRQAVEAAVASSSSSAPGTHARELLSFEEEEPELSWARDLNLGNRVDFDRFRQNLRRRRQFRYVLLLIAFGAVAAILAWGYFEGEWFERRMEVEPNNAAREATRLRLGTPLKGLIGRRLSDEVGDIDWYRIEHTKRKKRLLRITVTGIPKIDLVLEAFDAADAKRPLWVANDSGEGGGEVIPNLRYEKPIYLRVREVPGPGKAPTENLSDSYVLTATARPWKPNEEGEPNDDLFAANDVPLATAVTGFVSRKGDLDFFRFPRLGDKGETFRIECTPSAGSTPQVQAIAGGYRLPDKLPGKIALPVGDRSLFLVVQAPPNATLEAPYTLRVDRVP